VALDIHLDEALLAEGLARDLVNRIQNIRKEKDFNVTDRVVVTLEKHPAIVQAVERFHDYIKSEVLATDLLLHDTVDAPAVELNDEVALGIAVELS
jgi:isoleucyl-tRNA synthetase